MLFEREHQSAWFGEKTSSSEMSDRDSSTARAHWLGMRSSQLIRLSVKATIAALSHMHSAAVAASRSAREAAHSCCALIDRAQLSAGLLLGAGLPGAMACLGGGITSESVMETGLGDGVCSTRGRASVAAAITCSSSVWHSCRGTLGGMACKSGAFLLRTAHARWLCGAQTGAGSHTQTHRTHISTRISNSVFSHHC